MLYEETEAETSEGEGGNVDVAPAFGVSGQFMMTSEEKPVHSDDFNPRKIVALTLDDSLARLFECLTLEYSGSILLTPKWKNFRSQKLKFAEKVRINNAIWRSWHIQFKLDQSPLFCQFDNPLTEMATPPKPVTVLVEGRYWKRRLELVAAEYKKWRIFYKQMVEDKFQDVELQHQTEEVLRLDREISAKLKESKRERKFSLPTQEVESVLDNPSPVSLVVSQAFKVVDSCNLMESMVLSLPDTLFSSLDIDNQREPRLSTRTFTDASGMMQPTLDTLQPSLEAMTPVLNDLIEQLEASVKGAELNWDFSVLDKNLDEPINWTQSSGGSSQQQQFETMDHSGNYSDQSQPITSSQPNLVSSVASPWPMTSPMQRDLTTTSAFPPPPAVIAPPSTQAVGAEMPGLYSRGGCVDVKMSTSPPVVDLTGTSSVRTSETPYRPRDPVVGKQATVAARLRYSSDSVIPRNSSDSQLYTLATCGASRVRAETVPVEVQAPNLVAQLKMTKGRHPLLLDEKPPPGKTRTRIPRNKSAPGLANLDASAQLKKPPQAGGVRAKKLGRLPRNRSDSSLASLLSEYEQTGGVRSRRGSECYSPLYDVSASLSSPLAVVPSAVLPSVIMTSSVTPSAVLPVVLPPAVGSSVIGTSTGVPSAIMTSGVGPSAVRSSAVGSPSQAMVGVTSQQYPAVAHSGDVESMQQGIVPVPPVTISGSPPAVSTPVGMMSGVGGSDGDDGDGSSQLVNQAVTQLLSKGVSLEEILGKLTTMVETSAIPPQTSQPTPETSFASVFTTSAQTPQSLPDVRGIKAELPSTCLLPVTTSATSTQAITTRAEPAGRASQPRSRRKAQTPRASQRALQAERSAETPDTELRSTDDIIQNLLSQTGSYARSDIQPRTQASTVDASSIRVSPLGSVGRTSQHTLGSAQGLSESQRLGVSLSNLFPNTVSEQNRQFLGMTSLSNPVMTVAQATSSVRTSESSDMEGTSSSGMFSESYQMDIESSVRSRPLTKSLPKEQYIEHRRMVHVSAEQKRRGNIKMGFDQLISMVPALASQNSSKISKAAVLKTSVDYILQIQGEQEDMERERARLEKEIEALNAEISVCQEQLPETGVMVHRQDYDEMELLFNQFIRQRTEQNPKFWIFSIIFRPLFDAYCSTVSTSNTEEFFRSVLAWLNQDCCLPKLRPSVLTSLRELIKKTSILTDPSRLTMEARMAANALEPAATARRR